VGLALVAVLAKYATAALIPPTVFVLTARNAPTRGALVRRGLASAGLGGLMLAPLMLADIDLYGDRGGTGQLFENARRLSLAGGDLLLRCLLVAGLALIASAVRAEPAERSGVLRHWLATAVMEREGRVPFGALTAMLTALFAVPFLLNERYWKGYYAIFVAVFVGVFAARAISRVATPRLGAWRWLLGVALAGLLFPLGAIEASLAPTPSNRIEAWLAEAGGALAPDPRVRSVRLEASCGRPEETAESAALLAEIHRLDERGAGLRHAAGLDPGVRVTLDGDADRTLLYCESETPRFRLRAR